MPFRKISLDYYFFHNLTMPKSNNDKVARYYEEVLRLMNEMVVLLRGNNAMLKLHNRTVEELNERVRKISVNTSNI